MRLRMHTVTMKNCTGDHQWGREKLVSRDLGQRWDRCNKGLSPPTHIVWEESVYSKGCTACEATEMRSEKDYAPRDMPVKDWVAYRIRLEVAS